MTIATQRQNASPSRIAVDPRSMGHTPNRRRATMPFFMTREQEYYWHRSWQADERESLAEREAGEVFRFDSDDPNDAARFLDEGDLDD